jgi:hypothetical protein
MPSLFIPIGINIKGFKEAQEAQKIRHRHDQILSSFIKQRNMMHLTARNNKSNFRDVKYKIDTKHDKVVQGDVKFTDPFANASNNEMLSKTLSSSKTGSSHETLNKSKGSDIMKFQSRSMEFLEQQDFKEIVDAEIEAELTRIEPEQEDEIIEKVESMNLNRYEQFTPMAPLRMAALLATSNLKTMEPQRYYQGKWLNNM